MNSEANCQTADLTLKSKNKIITAEYPELEKIHKDYPVQSQFSTVEQVLLSGNEGILEEEAVCGTRGVRMCGMNSSGTCGTSRTSSGLGAASFPVSLIHRELIHCSTTQSWEGASVQAGKLQINSGKWGISTASLINKFNTFQPWALSGVYWWFLLIFVKIDQFELKKCSHKWQQDGKRTWAPHTWDRAQEPRFNSLPPPILTLQCGSSNT